VSFLNETLAAKCWKSLRRKNGYVTCVQAKLLTSKLKTWIINLSALIVCAQMTRFIIVFPVVAGVLGFSKIATAYVNASPSLSRWNARAQHWIDKHAIRLSHTHHRPGH
jgi:hypothetical protein